MRVVLVVPNFRWAESAPEPTMLWHYIPYNLCLLASMVRDICEVEIVDANQIDMSQEEFRETIEKINPVVVGITVLMDEYGEAGHIAAQLVKDVGWDIEVVMGGVYATTNAEDVMKDPNIDYVIIGEGEYVFKDLLLSLIEDEDMPRKGICYRSDSGIVNTGHSDLIGDLNFLPLPAYDLIDFSKYSNSANRKSTDSPKSFPYARVFSSRGCPLGCAFCQVNRIMGSQFRGRSAENVLQEIKWLKDTYGVKYIIFDDDNMLYDRNRAMDIFQGMIGMNLRWAMIATAVFEMDEEMIKVMRDSGCDYLDIAIETGTQRVMKQVIHKPVNFEYAKRMVGIAQEAGIYIAANYIVGFPTETWDEIRQTLKMAEYINADYSKINPAIPLKDTKLWELCEKENAFKKGIEKGKWSVGQIETKEFAAKHLIILRAFEWDRINFTDPKKTKRTCEMMGISIEEMNKIRKDTLANSLQLIKEE